MIETTHNEIQKEIHREKWMNTMNIVNCETTSRSIIYVQLESWEKGESGDRKDLWRNNAWIFPIIAVFFYCNYDKGDFSAFPTFQRWLGMDTRQCNYLCYLLLPTHLLIHKFKKLQEHQLHNSFHEENYTKADQNQW